MMSAESRVLSAESRIKSEELRVKSAESRIKSKELIYSKISISFPCRGAQPAMRPYIVST